MCSSKKKITRYRLDEWKIMCGHITKLPFLLYSVLLNVVVTTNIDKPTERKVVFNTYSFGWDEEKRRSEWKRVLYSLVACSVLAHFGFFFRWVNTWICLFVGIFQFFFFWSQLFKLEKMPNELQYFFSRFHMLANVKREVFEFNVRFCQQINLCEGVICLQGFFSVFEFSWVYFFLNTQFRWTFSRATRVNECEWVWMCAFQHLFFQPNLHYRNEF